MKKYIMCDNGTELKVGDIIEVTLTKEFKDGRIKHKYFKCKFIPSLIPLLLEKGIIEEKPFEGEPHKSEKEVIIESLIENSENLDLAVDTLYDQVNTLHKQVAALSNLLGDLKGNI